MPSDPAPAFFRYDPQRAEITLTVHVQPGAKSSAIVGTHGDALKIRIAAPAVDDKANAAVVRFLGELLGARLACIRIRQGSRNRRKLIEIADASAGLAARVRAMIDNLPDA